VSAPRPECSRRITPELMDYRKADAGRLRTEGLRRGRRMLRSLLSRLLRRR
jgi:hypothetical protein